MSLTQPMSDIKERLVHDVQALLAAALPADQARADAIHLGSMPQTSRPVVIDVHGFLAAAQPFRAEAPLTTPAGSPLCWSSISAAPTARTLRTWWDSLGLSDQCPCASLFLQRYGMALVPDHAHAVREASSWCAVLTLPCRPSAPGTLTQRRGLRSMACTQSRCTRAWWLMLWVAPAGGEPAAAMGVLSGPQR